LQQQGEKPVKQPNAKKKKRKRKSLAFKLTISFSIALVFTSVTMVGILYALSSAKFNPAKLLLGSTNPTVVYDRYGRVAFTIEPTGTRRVSLSKIPKYLQQGLIATEDVRFYQNHGFDMRSVLRSVIADVLHKNRNQGGSTITEQLGKVVYLQDNKSLRYKLEEILLAIQIDRYFNKNQILDMYFNTINFNGDTPGIENASQIYFQKDVNQLDLVQCALLAGLPQAPTEYDPFIHPHAALVRRNVVLSQMAKYGYLTQAQAVAAEQKPLEIASQQGILADGVPPQDAAYRDFLYEEANQIGIGARALQQGGLKIYTDLDPHLQLATFDQFQNNKYFPPNMNGNQAQGGAVFMSTLGGIEAIENSRPNQYQFGGFDYATETQRSPGSSIKPLVVYGPAIDTGRYNGDSLLYDGIFNIGGYHPQDWEYHPTINNQVTMRNALAMSWNIPAVWLLKQIGIPTGLDFAERAGLTFSTSDFYHLDVALGDIHPGTSPLQMADAFSSFDNNGQRVPGHAIERIVDGSGDTLYVASSVPVSVMKQSTASSMVGLLRNNVVNGIAQLSGVPGHEIAGKTGSVAYQPPGWSTSPGDSDLWFCGFSPSVVGSIWEGFPSTSLHAYIPNWVGGSALPAELFSAIMRQGLAGRASEHFLASVDATQTPAIIPQIAGLTGSYDQTAHTVYLNWTPVSDKNVYYLIFRGNAGEKNIYYNRSLARVTTPTYAGAMYVPGHYGYQVVAFDSSTHGIVGESGIASVRVTQAGTIKP